MKHLSTVYALDCTNDGLPFRGSMLGLLEDSYGPGFAKLTQASRIDVRKLGVLRYH